MRRWNGWGDSDRYYPLPEAAARFFAERVGESQHLSDAALEQILQSVPQSGLPTGLPSQLSVQGDPLPRLLHARGQSLPDWIALHSGRLGKSPDGVAYPTSDQDVRALIQYARSSGVSLIPYGGGTSVVGHINPLPGGPVLTVDMARMNRLVAWDETSRLATFEAGVCGPDLENQLRSRGFTLGHFPQSFELSTLGGWIATRSCGQQSYYYGRIEDLFAGGHLECPLGAIDLPDSPASAAGPDLRQLLLGSEGRLGILTRATMRVRLLPAYEAFYGIFFPDWQSGVQAVRQIAQDRIPVSMLRLSDAQETETTLALSGKESLVTWAERGLNFLGYKQSRCLLILGVTGLPGPARYALRQALSVARAQDGLNTGSLIGNLWLKSRFLAPYLRNSLWERGYALDTLETALPWSGVETAAAAILGVLHSGLESWGERVLAFAHLSHVYRDGASIYVTFLFRRSPDPDETLERWQALKSVASQVIITKGGTITHQHGVGLDHAPYLQAEKSALGMALLNSALQTLDPQGILNPGKLVRKDDKARYVGTRLA